MTESNLRIGVVGIPDGWSSIALADAFAARTGYRLLIDMREVVTDLATGAVWYGDVDLTGLDGIVIKKIGHSYSPDMLDRLEILRYLHDRGVPTFSRAERIIRLLDRLACTLTLAAGGIPMPPTIVTESRPRAIAAIEAYGEAVLKPLYSTKARGMMLVDAASDNVAVAVAKFHSDNPVMYIQKKLGKLDKDLGVVFMGGEYVGAYARIGSKDAWNTTILAGGKYAPHEPSAETIDIARRAQALFDLEFTSVDIVETPDGPLCFEVSAFGGFRGLTEGLGLDAAGNYADHIIGKLSS